MAVQRSGRSSDGAHCLEKRPSSQIPNSPPFSSRISLEIAAPAAPTAQVRIARRQTWQVAAELPEGYVLAGELRRELPLGARGVALLVERHRALWMPRRGR